MLARSFCTWYVTIVAILGDTKLRIQVTTVFVVASPYLSNQRLFRNGRCENWSSIDKAKLVLNTERPLHWSSPSKVFLLQLKAVKSRSLLDFQHDAERKGEIYQWCLKKLRQRIQWKPLEKFQSFKNFIEVSRDWEQKKRGKALNESK